MGELKTFATIKGICFLEFADQKERIDAFLKNHFPLETEIIKEINDPIDKLFVELQEYFSKGKKTFSVPLDPVGTDFQKLVWSALLEIPFGETRSYEQQSIELQNPKGIRAIATANGQNHIAIVIPCHRVIGKNGTLTGYAGGLERKRWLLDMERKFSGKPVQTTLDF